MINQSSDNDRINGNHYYAQTSLRPAAASHLKVDHRKNTYGKTDFEKSDYSVPDKRGRFDLRDKSAYDSGQASAKPQHHSHYQTTAAPRK